MKALPAEKLPEDDWLYEIKFDGYRGTGLLGRQGCAAHAIKTRPATSTAERRELTADRLLGVAMML